MIRTRLNSVLFASLVLLIGCAESQEDPQDTVPSASIETAVENVAEAANEVIEEVSPPPAAPSPNGLPYAGDSEGLAELKLSAPLDDTRGWCVDLFAHRAGAMPIGGLQGHNCFLYFGIGSPTEDQGIDVALFEETGKFRFRYFDACMTLHNPAPGSFVASDICSDDSAQVFTMSDEGLIQPKDAPALCLTIGPTTVPGGGRLPAPGAVRPPPTNDGIPLIRRLTFEACSGELATLQQWEFRSGDYVPDDRAEPHRFLYGQQ